MDGHRHALRDCDPPRPRRRPQLTRQCRGPVGRARPAPATLRASIRVALETANHHEATALCRRLSVNRQTHARQAMDSGASPARTLSTWCWHRTGPTTVTLHTTQHHPFWDQTDHRWVDARDLKTDHQLLTGDGATVTVVAVTTVTGTKLMRDLTIADIHTYYVIAGTTPVLVHNCNPLYKGDGFQHVLHEHVQGSPGVEPGNTLFSNHFDHEDIGDLIEDTVTHNPRGVPNNTDPRTGLSRDGTVHTKEYDYDIGTNGERILEVILNPNGSIRTAYPR